MTGDDLISDVRVLVQDATKPYLWSDDVILKYLREAEKLFCKGTHILVDPDVSTTVEANTPTHKVGDTILRIYAAKITGASKQLGRLRGAPYAAHMSDTIGTPQYFTTGLGDKYITVYPAPDVETALDLICAIMPSNFVELDTESEVPEEYQPALVDYATYRCLIIPDEDGENMNTAELYENRWLAAVRDAKAEIYRYRTGDKLVLTHWAGARNGRY